VTSENFTSLQLLQKNHNPLLIVTVFNSVNSVCQNLPAMLKEPRK